MLPTIDPSDAETQNSTVGVVNLDKVNQKIKAHFNQEKTAPGGKPRVQRVTLNCNKEQQQLIPDLTET